MPKKLEVSPREENSDEKTRIFLIPQSLDKIIFGSVTTSRNLSYRINSREEKKNSKKISTIKGLSKTAIENTNIKCPTIRVRLKNGRLPVTKINMNTEILRININK